VILGAWLVYCGSRQFRRAPGSGLLPTVDLHYGAYDDNAPSHDAVQVWGAWRPIPELIEFLAKNGYAGISEWSGGFRASRIDPAA
jgi:hypothetical protein